MKSTGLCWVWLSPCWVSLICVGFDCFHAGLNGPHRDSPVSGTPWVSHVSILGLIGLFVGSCWFVWGLTGPYTASHWFCEASPDSVSQCFHVVYHCSLSLFPVVFVGSQWSVLDITDLCVGSHWWLLGHWILVCVGFHWSVCSLTGICVGFH